LALPVRHSGDDGGELIALRAVLAALRLAAHGIKPALAALLVAH